MATIAVLAIGLASAGYGAYQAHETKQEQKAALNKAEATQQQLVKERTKKIIGQQKASFLASGISLTGASVDFALDETNVASQADANAIGDYYSTQIGTVTGQARAQYISSIGSAVSSYGAYSNSVSTSPTVNTSAKQAMGAN